MSEQATLFEETEIHQATRKIPVEKVYCDTTGWGAAYYGIVFKTGSKSTHRKEFAALRKEMQEFKKINPDAFYYNKHSTVGESWVIFADVLRKFADWMEFPEDLDTIMKRSVLEYEERKREEERQREERRQQRAREQRAKRVPCPSACKVKVLSIHQTEARDGYFDLDLGFLNQGALGIYSIELAECVTREEHEALETFCKALMQAQEDKSERYIQGKWRSWALHEYTLLHYSEWLEFPGADQEIDNIIRRAKADYVRRKEEEYSRWEERHSRGDYLGLNTAQGDILDALRVFGVDAEYIKKQYRTLAKQHHPDVGGDAEYFKRVHSAYQVLQSHLDNITRPE